jgi:uncharacterized protein involved in exopolysaccharide biosynthesis
MTVPASRLPERSADDGIALIGLLQLLWRHRRGVAVAGIGTALLFGVVLLLKQRTFEVRASFLPQARRSPAMISGLAAQLGLALPQTDPGANPHLYVDLLVSPEILGPVVTQRFAVRSRGDSLDGDIMTLLEIGEGPEDLRRDEAIRKLRGKINIGVNSRTSVVSFGVTTRWPDLSLQLTERILAQLDEFNQRTRQSQAAAEARFTEQRVAEVRADLREAENALQRFLQANRDVTNSTELQFQRDRLQREVNLRQEVYQTLAQSYEQARIEQVRDTPVFTLVERPQLPTRPKSRGVARGALGGLLLGMLLGIGGALFRRSLAATRAADAAVSA